MLQDLTRYDICMIHVDLSYIG